MPMHRNSNTPSFGQGPIWNTDGYAKAEACQKKDEKCVGRIQMTEEKAAPAMGDREASGPEGDHSDSAAEEGHEGRMRHPCPVRPAASMAKPAGISQINAPANNSHPAVPMG